MTFALLALGLIVGLTARRLNSLPAASSEWINGFIINIALPAMILLRIPALELNHTALIPVTLAWGVILVSASLVVVLARRQRWSREVTGAMLLVVPLSNSAYLGLPLIDAFADPEVLPYAIVYDQAGNFMGIAIYATIIVALYGRGDEPTAVSGIVKKVLTFPPFLTAIVALALPAGALPGPVPGVLKILATAMGPLAMVIVGMQLNLAVPPDLRRAVVAGCTIKLLVAPALVVATALALGLRGPAVAGGLLQAAMPPMITAGLIGIAAGFSRVLIVAVIGVASALGALTLPLAFEVAQLLSR